MDFPLDTDDFYKVRNINIYIQMDASEFEVLLYKTIPEYPLITKK